MLSSCLICSSKKTGSWKWTMHLLLFHTYLLNHLSFDMGLYDPLSSWNTKDTFCHLLRTFHTPHERMEPIQLGQLEGSCICNMIISFPERINFGRVLPEGPLPCSPWAWLNPAYPWYLKDYQTSTWFHQLGLYSAYFPSSKS